MENEAKAPERLLRKESVEEKDARELVRQEKYLERAKLYVGELEAVLGRQPTYHVQNFGCQMLTENRMQETA